MSRFLILVILGCYLAAGQTTKVDLQNQTRGVDFSAATSTKPAKTGTSLPGVCSTGEAFVLTTATPGTNFYICTATNTWSSQLGQTGPQGPAGPAGATGPQGPTGSISSSSSLNVGDGTSDGYVDLYPANDTTNSIGFTTSTRTSKLRLRLPSSDPATGQVLSCAAPSNGVSTCGWITPATGGGSSSGNATMTIDLPAGGVSAGNMTGIWDLAGSGGGGNTYYHALDFSQIGTPSFKATFRLPANFDAAQAVSVIATGGNGNGVAGNVSLKFQIACFGAGQSLYLDPVYGSTLTLGPIAQGGTNLTSEGTASGLPLAAACDSSKMARLMVTRDNSISGNLPDVYSVQDVALIYGTK